MTQVERVVGLDEIDGGAHGRTDAAAFDHHIMFEPVTGPTSNGRCKKCGKKFVGNNLEPVPAWGVFVKASKKKPSTTLFKPRRDL